MKCKIEKIDSCVKIDNNFAWVGANKKNKKQKVLVF